MMARRRGGAWPAAIVVALGTACAPAPRRAVVPAAAPDSARGVVRVVGAVPQPAVVLEAAGGHGVELTGPLAPELALLDGAVVTVHGPAAVPPVPLGSGGRAIAVRAYVIDSIAGGVPVVGVLERAGAGAVVGGVPIADPPPDLLRLAGGKVWVIGTRGSDGALRVDAYGSLVPAATPPRTRP